MFQERINSPAQCHHRNAWDLIFFPFHKPLQLKRGLTPSQSLWLFETTYSSLGCAVLAHLLSSMKSHSFQEQEQVFQQIRAVMKAALPLGLSDPGDPMLLAVSVADKNMSHCQ